MVVASAKTTLTSRSWGDRRLSRRFIDHSFENAFSLVTSLLPRDFATSLRHRLYMEDICRIFFPVRLNSNPCDRVSKKNLLLRGAD